MSGTPITDAWIAAMSVPPEPDRTPPLEGPWEAFEVNGRVIVRTAWTDEGQHLTIADLENFRGDALANGRMLAASRELHAELKNLVGKVMADTFTEADIAGALLALQAAGGEATPS